MRGLLREEHDLRMLISFLTWFSASQSALRFRFVRVKGKWGSRFPETSST